MIESTTTVDSRACAASRAAAIPASPTTVLTNGSTLPVPEEADKSSCIPSKTPCRKVGSRRRTPLRTPKVKSFACKTSGRTPHREKAIRKPEYRVFRSDRKVARAMARTRRCFLCSVHLKGRKITEHDHHTGVFRGVTCGSCNTRDGKAVKAARRRHNVSKADYEAGKPMPCGFFDTYAKELSSRLGIEYVVCREYITGDRWRKFRDFF